MIEAREALAEILESEISIPKWVSTSIRHTVLDWAEEVIFKLEQTGFKIVHQHDFDCWQTLLEENKQLHNKMARLNETSD